jgi:hypothetical protein
LPIDADGFVAIVDRKKEIIINSSGKNMSPTNIEASVRNSSPIIGQVWRPTARPWSAADPGSTDGPDLARAEQRRPVDLQLRGELLHVQPPAAGGALPLLASRAACMIRSTGYLTS